MFVEIVSLPEEWSFQENVESGSTLIANIDSVMFDRVRSLDCIE